MCQALFYYFIFYRRGKGEGKGHYISHKNTAGGAAKNNSRPPTAAFGDNKKRGAGRPFLIFCTTPKTGQQEKSVKNGVVPFWGRLDGKNGKSCFIFFFC